MFCTRARSCVRADDAKILHSREVHATRSNFLGISLDVVVTLIRNY